MKKKIVLIGAGSAQFGLGSVSDIFHSKILQGSHIVLHDINPDALKMVYEISRKVMVSESLPFTISATTSRKDALKGADFYIISIEVGNRFDLWEQDWKVPLKYGNRQIYGENGGPGGLFHSLRIIPPIIEICRDVERYCPQAYGFNFSNPMSRICLAVKRRFPHLRFIGLCHEITSMPHHLPKILKIPFSELAIKAAGLNHFTVLLEVKYRKSGKDAYPELKRRAVKYFRSYRKGTERSLVLDVFKKFDCLPVSTDSHFGEYIQWAWEIADHKGIKDFYSRYKKSCLAQYSRYLKILKGESQETWWKESTGERITPIIEGILTGSGYEELAVNIPNKGLIENLPEDLVVEVPAKVSRKGVVGVKIGLMPKGIVGLLNNQATVQDLAVEAALTGSRRIALQALLADPVVDSFRNAEKILDAMLRLQKKYLSYIK